MNQSKNKKKRTEWKKYQKDTETHKKVMLGIGVLVLLCFLILTSKLFDLVGTFSKPYRPDDNNTSYKQSLWDGKERLNLVLKSDLIYLLTFNAKEVALTLVEIPDDTYFNLPRGFGRWSVRSIYGLGQAEKVPFGAVLLKDTLSANLSIPIDGYILFDEKTSIPKFLEKIKNNPFSALTVFQDAKTDLSISELGNLVWKIKGVREDKYKEVDFGQSSLTEWVLLADGSRVLGLNQIRLDQFARSQFEDFQLSEEGLSIGVFNTTSHPGLAEKAARLIGNMGGRVTLTNSSALNLKQSVVVGKLSYSRDRLGEIFGSTCGVGSKCLKELCQSHNLKISECSLENLKLLDSRADVTVLLGEDYYLRYNSK